MHKSASYSLLSEQAIASSSGCIAEVSHDGSALLVVDGEPLFRFSTLSALLTQYGLVRGELSLA